MVKILVVDDVPEHRHQLVNAIRESGREVQAAASRAEGEDRIEHEDFDVVVTDLRMEDKRDGLAVLKAARRKDPTTQVIFVSQYGTPELSAEVMRSGAIDFLERNPSAIDFWTMLDCKVKLAIEFRRLLKARPKRRGRTA